MSNDRKMRLIAQRSATVMLAGYRVRVVHTLPRRHMQTYIVLVIRFYLAVTGLRAGLSGFLVNIGADSPLVRQYQRWCGKA